MDDLRTRVKFFRGGCIRNHYEKWVELTSDPEILETVSGMSIDLVEDVPSTGTFQYPFGVEESLFIQKEIQRLLEKGIIVKCHHEPGELVSPIFLREKSDGDGFRMILNLKKLNSISEKEHFKMDTLKSVLNLITPGVYMAKLDIKDAYYSVPIRDRDQKLLKFMFDGELLKFVALPNGYTKGPRKFTKLLKPIWAKLREKGITLIAYLDDIIVLGWNKEVCRDNIITVLQTLQAYGFVLHPTKSDLNPVTCIEFLGFIIDSILMRVYLPEEKKAALKTLCTDTIDKNNFSPDMIGRNTIRGVASLLGKISSSFIGVAEGRLHYRRLEKAKTMALKWNKGKFNKNMDIPPGAIKDICWWRDYVQESWAPIIRGNPDVTLTTDACCTGWGAVRGEIRTGGLFSLEDRQSDGEETHINVLEAKAVYFALLALGKDLYDSHIQILSDNTATVGSLNKMGSSKSKALDRAIIDSWYWALSRNNWITACHIPGVLNVEADEESRSSESKTEWMLNKDVFNMITEQLGFTPDIDLFASRINKQLDRFMAFRPDPEAEFIDSFSVPWTDTPFYAFPPFICVGRTLQKIKMDGATGILVVPDWPNQCWYNVYRELVVHEVILHPRSDLLMLPNQPEQLHPLHQTLTLRAGLVSGTGLWDRTLRNK